TDVAARLVRRAARWADHGTLAVRIGNEHGIAARALGAQVLEAGEPAALALPVADRVLDELERRVLPEVADREDGLEDRLQAHVLTFGRQTIHLKKPLVRFLLDLDQVRDRDSRLDLGEIDAFAVDVLGQAVHSVTPRDSCGSGGPAPPPDGRDAGPAMVGRRPCTDRRPGARWHAPDRRAAHASQNTADRRPSAGGLETGTRAVGRRGAT